MKQVCSIRGLTNLVQVVKFLNYRAVRSNCGPINATKPKTWAQSVFTLTSEISGQLLLIENLEIFSVCRHRALNLRSRKLRQESEFVRQEGGKLLVGSLSDFSGEEQRYLMDGSVELG